LRRVELLFFEGQRVVVDASFREEVWRRTFLEMAQRWGVPAIFLLCHANANTVRRRLSDRRGDVSDADWTIYLQAAQAWQEPGSLTHAALRTIDTESSSARPLDQALLALCDVQLYG
jgi:predicted kinase